MNSRSVQSSDGLDPHLVELLEDGPVDRVVLGHRPPATNPGTSTRWVSRILATRFR